jgi:hypothetical protein
MMCTSPPGMLVRSRTVSEFDTCFVSSPGSARWGNHPSFAARNGDEAQGRPGAFIVSHWDSQTTYSLIACNMVVSVLPRRRDWSSMMCTSPPGMLVRSRTERRRGARPSGRLHRLALGQPDDLLD